MGSFHIESRCFFKSTDLMGCEVNITELPDRKIGSISFPQTEICISGDNAEQLYKGFELAFLSAGG